VIDMGIVRRRKVDVAADLPSRRVVDLPVELDDDLGRSIRQAERELAARLVTRFNRAAAAGVPYSFGGDSDAHRTHLVRLVAQSELEESKSAKTGENVFTMVRKIGQAKANLASDYAAQLARSVGKVVFFAKHIDVMDAAEQAFAARDLRTISIRGDQTAVSRQKEIDAFNNDPDVAVAVCSLTAAGVGLNLQAASNVVLAELSWTAAEQTQAIDRVHRASSLPRPSIRRSPSSSTPSRGSPHGPSMGRMSSPAQPTLYSSMRSFTFSPRHSEARSESGRKLRRTSASGPFTWPAKLVTIGLKYDYG
jgi:SNF2 family DNA or RNA helicase